MKQIKFKYLLAILAVSAVLFSCQKGGEPVPYGESETQIDEVFEYSNQREGEGSNGAGSTGQGNVYSPGGIGDAGAGSGGETVIGGDDNEDDDDTIIGGGDIIIGGDNNDDDDNVGDGVLDAGGK